MTQAQNRGLAERDQASDNKPPFSIQLGPDRWQSGAQVIGRNVRESTGFQVPYHALGKRSAVCRVLLFSNTFPEFRLSLHWVAVSVR
jgi:hypothetical protein